MHKEKAHLHSFDFDIKRLLRHLLPSSSSSRYYHIPFFSFSAYSQIIYTLQAAELGFSVSPNKALYKSQQRYLPTKSNIDPAMSPNTNRTISSSTSPTVSLIAEADSKTSMLSSIIRRNPAFQAKIDQLALRLAPLVGLTTGEIHPYFPSTLLNFWLLTSEQLDELAHFYDQRTPNFWSAHYPCPVAWAKGLTLEEKRRKMGKFIGLRGCETPDKTEEEILEELKRRREEEDTAIWRRKLGWY